jgi:uncharacterized protein (UPF0335 family)
MELSNSKLQERLNTISGKITFLKQEKTRLEKEKASVVEELTKEGITDVTLLPSIIETKKAELETVKTKFAENVGKLEVKIAELEEKVKC